MRLRAIHLLAVLAVLALLLPSPVKAQTASSVFQTGLVTEKSSYKFNEMVYAQLILYNPTPQRIAVHFSGECWFSFVVRDMLGSLIHNETWSDCDPDINGYENTTNVMTVDPSGGRWTPLSWNQLDLLGKHVPVSADYVLSWSFKNPDQPIPEASKTITLTDQVQSQLESFSAAAFRNLQNFAPLVWFVGFVGTIPWSRTLKDTKRSARLRILVPTAASGVAIFTLIIGFYSNQLLCLAIQCPGTISLLNRMNVYLLITPVVWAILFLAGRMVPQKMIWVPLVIFESWTFSVLAIAFSVLSSAQELWRNTFYYDWNIIWPSYGLFLASIPAQLIFYRAFKKKLLSTAPFVPVVKPPPWPIFPVKNDPGQA
ncbi:hypothetical protein E6H31_05205 [Candidatus Bathyarchaeota archaeon]|nr:MAG: hypothetical protein E6H31_05205 [Candidatus Bathyarchaeota archaeon]